MITRARTNNGSKINTNKEFGSTITTFRFRLTRHDKDIGTQQNGVEAAGQPPSVLGHPLPLMLPTLTANTAVDIGGVSSMREVVPTRCRQGGLKRCRPLPVHPGHTPNLIRCQV